MPQLAINNSVITTFRFSATLDIYNRTLTMVDMSTYAGSSGSGIFSVAGISFSIIDQAGVELATIGFTDSSQYFVPSVTNEFEIDLSSLPYTFLFQTYKITGAIKDSGGNVFTTVPVYKKMCSPVNITDSGYVPGIFQITPNCPDNVLTVKELTLFTYNNQDPVSKTKSGTLSYPTGTISAVSFTNTPFSNNVIYTGEYRVNCTTTAEYDLEDDVYVLVTYITNNVFPVTCANKIADLICCMVDLQTTYLKNCNNAVGKNAQQKLGDVVIPFMLGLTKEINGQDASTEADLIRKTLNCDCGATSVRQNEFTPINAAASSIVLTGVGGTTIPAPTITGNTKQYNIASSVYQVVKGNTGDLAFTIEVDNSTANLVKYKITFNYNTMAGYILNAIGGDAALVAQLNSLITFNGNIDLTGLNGSCVIDLSTNLVLVQSVTAATSIIALNTTTTTYNAPSELQALNAVAVQTWLNTLGLGTFTVTYNAGVVTILSLNNTSAVVSLTFGSPNQSVVFQRTNVSLVAVLQAIIDYLCALTGLQIALGANVTLWQIDYNGVLSSQGFTSNQSQAVLNQGIAESIYNIVQRISLLTGITCEKIAAVFSDSPNISFTSSSRLYGSNGAACVAWTDKQVALGVIAAIQGYTDVKEAFCAIDCETPGTCPDITDINVAMVGNDIGIYSTAWSQTPLASQTVTVYYKLSSAANYTVATNALVINPNGTVQNNSPYLILGGVQGETYDVKIVNNCGGVGFVKQITVPTGTAYTGNYLVDNILYLICANSPVTYYTNAPFAVGVVVYTNIGMTIPLTGYTYIAESSGKIYTISSTTGQVLADTGSSCSNGVQGNFVVGNDTALICGIDTTTGYTNGAFAVGGTLYQDAALTTPLTGFSYVVNTANNHIYNLNSVPGIIGSDTTLSCGSYSRSFRQNNLGDCSGTITTLYSAAIFGPGVTMYTDAGLTILASGYLYIYDVDNDTQYNQNSTTAVVGSELGSCS